jgi:hypothetical protein
MMNVRVVASDGVELPACLFDAVVQQKNIVKKMYAAYTFTEAVSALFTVEKLYCKEAEDGIECERDGIRFKVRRGEGKEVVVAVGMPSAQLLARLLCEVFDAAAWAQTDAKVLYGKVHKLERRVRLLRKLVVRLVWRR